MMSDYWWLKETNPIDAIRLLLDGGRPERVPFCPRILGHAAKIMGYRTLGEFYEFPKVAVKGIEIATEMYQSYLPTRSMAGTAEYWMKAWGAEYMLPYQPKMGSITLVKPVVKTPEDMEKLQVPDPAPYLSAMIEGTELLMAKKMLPWVFVPAGWLSAAGYSITEPETIMFWIHKQPDLVHKILDMSAEFGIRLAECFVKKLGTEGWIPWDANPTDSNTLISADMFAKFPMPRAIRVHQKFLDMGCPMWATHWCSDHNKTMAAGYVDKVPLGKPGIIHFGTEVPIEKIVERYGKRHLIMGNVDPPSIMTKSFDEVVELSKKNIEVGMRAEKGYTLSAGCELPPPAPPANVYAMVKACREFGKYS
jgi:uroporphyrinogen decarboxylase